MSYLSKLEMHADIQDMQDIQNTVNEEIFGTEMY